MQSNKKNIKSMGISGVITLILVFLDQITKYIVVANLKGASPVVLIDGVFEFRYLENQSAAFGVDLVTIIHRIFNFSYFNNNPESFLRCKMIFFVVFTVIVIGLIVMLYKKVPSTRRFLYMNIALVLFVAGAIGNLIDRVVNNYVVDFFYFILIDFPIFNVADIYVTVAAFMFIVFGLFYYKESDYEIIFNKNKIKDDKNAD